MTDATRRGQQMMGWLWLAVVCFINTIPLLIVSVLANLSHIAAYVPFLQTWQQNSEWTFALMNGILPPTISTIFAFFVRF
jgi:calcium permeable stress-gated cation channel